MTNFTLEILRRTGEAPTIAELLELSDERLIWCHVEALALRIRHGDGAYILVKNSKGQTVIRAGVRTALASIEACPCPTCSLKAELKLRVSPRSHAQADFGVDFTPCPRRGLCPCCV